MTKLLLQKYKNVNVEKIVSIKEKSPRRTHAKRRIKIHVQTYHKNVNI